MKILLIVIGILNYQLPHFTREKNEMKFSTNHRGLRIEKYLTQNSKLCSLNL